MDFKSNSRYDIIVMLISISITLLYLFVRFSLNSEYLISLSLYICIISFPLSTIWFFAVALGIDHFSLSTSNYFIEILIALGFGLATFFQWKFINKPLYQTLRKYFKIWRKS
ncbi:MAG: Na+-transporting methylmalonyl-CoA/oxaloacetate decarboxylase beta subunit [Bacteriovoracaceae bacterium]|jgi:Na+-transporting methylmalonyl-CoA/oxaloacetate decarboxylase beta subunit